MTPWHDDPVGFALAVALGILLGLFLTGVLLGWPWELPIGPVIGS